MPVDLSHFRSPTFALDLPPFVGTASKPVKKLCGLDYVVLLVPFPLRVFR